MRKSALKQILSIILIALTALNLSVLTSANSIGTGEKGPVDPLINISQSSIAIDKG